MFYIREHTLQDGAKKPLERIARQTCPEVGIAAGALVSMANVIKVGEGKLSNKFVIVSFLS